MNRQGFSPSRRFWRISGGCLAGLCWAALGLQAQWVNYRVPGGSPRSGRQGESIRPHS
jgi:hypothetical protein